MVSDLKVRELPLVCTAASVRALLAGEKTQHREPVKRLNTLVDGRGVDAPTWESLDLTKAWVDRGPSPAGNPGPYLKAPHLPDGRVHLRVVQGAHDPADCVHRLYPRVQVGDRLWVRERLVKSDSGAWLYAHGCMVVRVARGERERAQEWFESREGLRSCSPRHLPRWASRLTLEVAEIRVHRLQEITEQDAVAEGWRRVPVGGVEAFRCVWDLAHYQRGDGWDANPWVWVYTVARVES